MDDDSVAASDTSDFSEALAYAVNRSVMTTNDEIVALLGPPRDSLTTVIPMTLVYIMILVTGLFGNLCTCFVIVKNRYMHTTVNFYLFSLAVSDLLLLIVGLPTELWAFWQKYPYAFGETFCVLRALISEACSYASVLTITAFTVERYIAICHPLKAHTMAQLSRAIKAILFIWVIATLSSIPISLQLGIIYQVICRSVYFMTVTRTFVVHCLHQISKSNRKPLIETAQCALKNRRPYAFTVSTVIFFVLPMSLILTLYFLIGLQLRRSSKSMGRASTSGSTSLSVNHKTFARECESESHFGNSDPSRNQRSSAVERQGSRYLHATPNSNSYRQHAASRRAVVKMLGEL